MKQKKLTAAGTKAAAKTKTARKTLEEMNLLDDFLFGVVLSYPDIGERFVRILLKTIFGREFTHLSVTAQKVLYGVDTSLHGARLDVYIEPEIENSEGTATVYDIEPDLKDSLADKKALPRRVRFYHGKIAARSLNSGADYDTLKNVVVIMIVPFDPFGQSRMMYTIKSKCVELPEMEYDDGASTLFLYTKGTEGIPSVALRQLLRYMEETISENAVNDELREIHRMVQTVKKDPEVGGMRIQIIDENIKMAQKIEKQTAEIGKQTAEIDRQAAEIEKQTAKIEKQTTEIEKQTTEIEKQAAEIARLREELERMRRAAAEKVKEDRHI